MPEPLLAGVLFAGSLVLLLIRPRWLPDWAAALGGGVLMLALGTWTPRQALQTLADSTDVLLFFLGLGLVAATADRAGLFEAMAHFAATAARGSQRRLLVGLFVVGTILTAVLSNDATALLLTPVAFSSATRLGLNPRPYVYACALVANAASFVLPVSNPANLLILERTPLTLEAFLARLLVPSVVVLAATLAGLMWMFREELRSPFAEVTASGPLLSTRTRASLLGVCGLGVVYVVGAAVGWPLGRLALAGAVLLTLVDVLIAGLEPRRRVHDLPFGLVALVIGLLLLVGGAEQVNLFAPLVRAIDAISASGASALPGLVIGMALLANITNNLPAALVAASALGSLPTGADQSDLVAAMIVGVNLGPNLTTVGSLATMLWLVLLRRRGLEVSAVEYVRVGGLVTVPALLLGSAALWLISRALT